MERSYLALMLLCSLRPEHMEAHTIRVPHGIPLETPVIAPLDGKFNLNRVMKFADRVDQIITHNYGKEGTIITLEDLIIAAREQQTDAAKVDRFLKNCITNFVKIIREEGFLKDFQAIYPLFQELLEAWARQRNKYDSPFYKFGSMVKKPNTEHEVLMATLTSLTLYQLCLLDCKEFLEDIMTSLPKSYALYIETLAAHGKV